MIETFNTNKTVSRLAPTPNGHLHLGNAFNFLMIWTTIRKRNGVLHLRIDDIDQARVRKEYIEDIFFCIDWLGIDFDFGPSGPSDFSQNYSQLSHMDSYEKALKSIQEVYVCECSRKSIKKYSSPIYPQVCLHKNLIFSPLVHQIRIHCPDGSHINVSGQTVDVSEVLGDFVVWRKDNIASYQLASVVDDERLGVNLVIRGGDLFDSTAAQLFLAKKLNFQNFLNADFIHHDLLLGSKNEKLSKSIHSQSLAQMASQGISRQDVLNQFLRFMSIKTETIVNSSKELLQIMIDRN